MNDLVYNSSLLCDQNYFGIFGHPSSYMNNDHQHLFSTNFDTSTGYLQDALVDKFNDKSEKRHLAFFSENQRVLNDNSSFNWELYENLNYLTKTGIFDESRDNVSEQANVFREIKKHEDAMFLSQDSNQWNSVDSANSIAFMLHSGEETNKYIKKKAKKSRKVYPFSVVKPGSGINEGEVTLKEINQRISKPLVRRVKHPVGEYACKPNVMSLNGGPGLSGKSVVSLTRIHTLGRGTITIIRTKG